MTNSLTSTAQVVTERPARYGKQLVAHLGRRSPGSWDDAAGTGEIRFEHGTATLHSLEGVLHLSVTTAPDAIGRLEDVLGRHLVRFATRDSLEVSWRRSDGTAGTHQSSAAPRSDE